MDMEASSMRVAVIGAGVGGLVAARELRDEGHAVQVFESSSLIGGIWALNDAGDNVSGAPMNPLQRVRSCLYDTMRTNLPRELMGFSDFPFMPEYMMGRSEDDRRFCHYSEFLRYLNAFADYFHLRDMISLNSTVVTVKRSGAVPSSESAATALMVDSEDPNLLAKLTSHHTSGSRGLHESIVPVVTSATHTVASTVTNEAAWEVHVKRAGALLPEVHLFDAVVVATGHHSVPRVPDIPGLEHWPGQVEHSLSYRRAEDYAGQSVLIIGAGSSGEDISHDISAAASRVYVASKAAGLAPWFGSDDSSQRVQGCAWVREMEADGRIKLENGSILSDIDTVMFCTGFNYSFPFLASGTVDTSESQVRPLYLQMFTPRHGASLSFIGIPSDVAPALIMELQAKVVARLLSGNAKLPPADEMWRAIDDYTRFTVDTKMPVRHIHRLGPFQWNYAEAIADMADLPYLQPWVERLWEHTHELQREHGFGSFREEWTDDSAGAEEAKAHFASLTIRPWARCAIRTASSLTRQAAVSLPPM